MKSQLILGIVLVLSMFCFSSLKVEAEPQTSEEEIGLDPSTMDFENVDKILEETGTDEILKSQTKVDTVGQLLLALLSGDMKISGKEWGAVFGNLLWGNLKIYMGLMLQVVGLALMSQLFNSLTLQFSEAAVGEVGFVCVYSVLVLVLLESFQLAYQETKQTVEAIRDLSFYMMPAMAAVAVAAGFPLSSILQGEALTGGFSLILTLMKDLFIVAVLWITVLETINLIGKRPVLSQLTSLGRTLIEKGVKTVSTLYLLAMGIFGAVTPAADRVVYKVSHTLLAAVPVVGSAMSGAMDSVMTGGVLVKNGIGAAGCIVLLCICLVPVAKLAAFWLIYRLMAAFLSPVADDRIIQLLKALGKSTAILLGILVAGMIIFSGAVGILVVMLR